MNGAKILLLKHIEQGSLLKRYRNPTKLRRQQAEIISKICYYTNKLAF